MEDMKKHRDVLLREAAECRLISDLATDNRSESYSRSWPSTIRSPRPSSSDRRATTEVGTPLSVASGCTFLLGRCSFGIAKVSVEQRRGVCLSLGCSATGSGRGSTCRQLARKTTDPIAVQSEQEEGQNPIRRRKGSRRHRVSRLREYRHASAVWDLPFLFFFCTFSVGAFGAFFEAISALS